jgi:hypothetical protein
MKNWSQKSPIRFFALCGLALFNTGYTAACMDPCDAPEAWVGNAKVASASDIDALEDVICIQGSLVIGDIEHDPEDIGTGIQAMERGFQLTNIDGLESLEYVEGDLHIAGNALLTSLEGLKNLGYAGRELRPEKYPRGDLIIHDNLILSDLSGIETLHTVGANAVISNNVLLSDLSGMKSLEKVGWELRILDNPSLETEDAQDFSEDISAFGGVLISGNAGAGGGS